MEAFAESSPEALSYFPAAANGPYGMYPERYLDLVRRGRGAVAIPIIASLNGSSRKRFGGDTLRRVISL
jgi:dihydroorotate dehydrogenase (fumarate)